jgi:uncharacterized membrane protein
LPQAEVEERVNFYAEMIDDRMEDGSTEEEAVACLGPIDAIVSQIVSDIPLLKIAGKAAKQRIKQTKKMKTWEIVLLAVGSPVWFPILIALAASALAIYVSFWAVIISLWAAFGSLAGCAFAGIVGGTVFAIGVSVPSGFALISAGIACAGLSIFTFFGCKAATKGLILLAGKSVLAMKRCLIKKEGAI